MPATTNIFRCRYEVSDSCLLVQRPAFQPSSPYPSWLRGTVVERRYDRRTFPVYTLDLQMMGDHLCGQTVRYKVSQLGQLSLSSF